MFKPFSVTATAQDDKAAAPQLADDPEQWQSWRLGALTTRKTQSPRVHVDATDIEFEQQSELRVLREQAYQEAYSKGLTAGREAGHKEGFEHGYAEGQEQAQHELQQQLETNVAPLQALVQTFEEALREVDTAVAEHLVHLALQAGRQLAGEALEAKPEAVLEVVRELLQQDETLYSPAIIYLHPDDLDLVKTHMTTDLERARWQVQADPRLSRGGCRVVSKAGELDASMETRWQLIQQQLRGRS
ncbi:flagellar assembly protein FliH [Pseudidiomarina aestuarii]|uniref:Flagellar assembly protein FliH n=1 Tax=Pseudidiomarina aestuarii TaxID=624146 RepID=A0A7Z6ZVI1_9GAMM|nr:flagellar assembly protein FliH [Pseudidiomarina aestuarii]RUO42147.1 flagellar assembly protein FliH [Pseudidiomarina aestuarii]